MNNQKLKKVIILLIILLLLIIIAILSICINIKNDEQKIISEEISGQGENTLETYGKNSSGGIDSQSYFDVKEYMQKYLDIINMNNLQYGYYDENNNYIAALSEKDVKQKIYNVLSNKFIDEKNITVDNIGNHIKVLQEYSIFVPIEISLIQDSDIKSFLVYGLAEKIDDYSVIGKIFAVININVAESVYSVEPIYGDYNSINEIKIERMEDTIIANEDNEFFQTYKSVKEIPAEYINLYKGLALGAPEKLYDLLDEEYKNTKFGNIDEFKRHIQKNKSKIVTARIDKYKVDVYDDYVRYVCIDKNGNSYIITQKEILTDFTMMLDAYTINLPEFIEKYDSVENSQKVVLNIEKLIEATKSKDYNYVYSKLDDTFKFENFETQEDFERYINEKYDEDDKITFEKYEKFDDVYIYDTKITDKSNNGEKKAKIVMQLKDERDFVFSFSIQ